MRVINQLLFPLLTIPYISRVLGAEGVGIVEYFIAISAYGLLISGFGLTQYASLEIAKLKENPDALRKSTISTFNFQLLATILGGIIFFVIGFFLGITDMLMMSIFLFKILLNLFRVEWYFIGKENFKYIAIRDLIVKTIFLVIIFIFIKDTSDIYYYALALVLGDGIANLFNIKKMVSELNIKISELFKIKYKDLISIYRASLPFFISSFAITVYITLNKIMLGQMIGQEYVGYYSMPDRLVRIAMGVALALVVSTTPRLAYYYQHDRDKYFTLLNNSTNFMLMLTFPMFIGILIMSEDIIPLVFGQDFLPAIPTLQILSMLLIIVPFANTLGLQILNVTGKAKQYTISVIVATILNIVLNIFLIDKFKQDGAAVASIIAEIIGVMVQTYYVSKLFSLKKIFDKKILTYFFASLVMGVCMLIFRGEDMDLIYRVVIHILIGIISYFGILILFKDAMLWSILSKIKVKQ